MELLNEFKCNVGVCDFKAKDGRSLLSHFRIKHNGDPQFYSVCFYSKNCDRTFQSYGAMYTHLKNYHEDFFTSNASVVDVQVPSETFENSPLIEEETQVLHMVETPVDIVRSEEPCYAGAEFVLNLLTERKMNQVSVQYVIGETTKLVNNVMDAQLEKLKTLLQSNGIDTSCLTQATFDAKAELFQGMQNQRSQNIYFHRHYGMIKPIQVNLKPSSQDVGRHRTGRDQFKKQPKYIYVPLLQLLERLMQFKDLAKFICEEKQQTDSLIWASYYCGSNFKNNILFQKHPNALQIHLYLDEVQLCNELSSRTKKNKFVFVYFSLGNVNHKLRSSLSSIYLLSIFTNLQMIRYGLNVLLRPIIDDIKKLELGFEMLINGESKVTYGTVTAIVADNLASHQIGGFKSGFASGYRKCRTCLATPGEIQTKHYHTDFVLRSQEQHDIQVESLGVEKLRKHFSKLNGLNGESVLNELKYFHVIGGLVPDLMHDLLEGVVPLTMCELLLHCINRKYINLEHLNSVISNFDYGYHEALDKPSLIDIKHLKSLRLRQSSVQTWSLATLLPLMIGNKIPAANVPFKCFRNLLEICRLCFMDSFNSCDLVTLDWLIDDFLDSFKTCFQRKITPKMHHLIHYSDYIKKMGPLISLWCMRFESKHAYFKQLQRSIKNYINIPLTLSMRHQQWQCNKFRLAKNKLLNTEI